MGRAREENVIGAEVGLERILNCIQTIEQVVEKFFKIIKFLTLFLKQAKQ